MRDLPLATGPFHIHIGPIRLPGPPVFSKFLAELELHSSAKKLPVVRCLPVRLWGYLNVSFPVQITYRDVDVSPSIEAWVRKQASKLNTFHERIVRCHVMIELAHRHLRRGNRFQVKVHLIVPGGEVAVRSLSAPVDPEKFLDAGRKRKKQEIGAPQKELRQAVASAFHSTGRRLQDLVRRQRNEVKPHEMPLARVVDLFPKRGYGFLETSDGRLIYFHRNSVLHRAFSRLSRGMQVTFAEEAGEQGPQASTVRPVSRPRQAKRQPVAA